MTAIARSLTVALATVFLFSSAFADSSYVKGHVKKDGTYVQPHMRTTPNNTKLDNWSTKGNTNPYTGKEGTKDPYKAKK